MQVERKNLKVAAKKQRRTITRSEVCRLAFCNSERLPLIINDDGRRKHWIGIGWVDEGAATGSETKVIED